MEILSTGEKIKRARIYRGYTLKELCDKKISVSKMSCIENGKIKPEEWVLKFIANKLEIDLLYLKQDIKDQIVENINRIVKDGKTKDYEDTLRYNLKFAKENCYNDICFRILHLLFKYYLDTEEIEKAQSIIHNYYCYLQKCFSYENSMIYYIDIAKWFFACGQFLHSVSYYNNAIDIALKSNRQDFLIEALYNQAVCYFEMFNYEKSYNLAYKVMNLIDYVKEDMKKAKIYHLMALLYIKTDMQKFEMYKQKVDELYGSDLKNKAKALFDYARIMFILGMKDDATAYLIKARDMYPKDDINELAKFYLTVIEILINNILLDSAQQICDTVLNYAISLNNMKYIERAYYYKAVILVRQGNFEFGEMYMNLSLDTLLKFATSTKIYKRYMKMGQMYYKMGSTSEAIKYFDFAVKLDQKYGFL